MKLETFFEKFELFADAPDAVAKMRELVLALAVQGGLVPQDASDEPAAKALHACGVDLNRWTVGKGEQRCGVPDSWSWVKFAGVGEQRLGKMLDAQKNCGKPKCYLRNTNVQWMRFELEDLKMMRVEEREADELRLRRGDLLICEGGEPGRCAIWRDEMPEMYFQKALHRVRPCKAVLSEYLAINLQVDCRNGVLASYFTGATIKHLTGRSLSEYAVPIPPLAEQKRIVAKVDELMALCDRLEAQQQERETRHAALARAALARFAEAPTPANLEFLFHKSYAIFPTDLRKSIFTLAVQGKLVPQDPEGESSEAVLRQIELARKYKKNADRKIKSQSAYLIKPSDRPYEIPNGWYWRKLGMLGLISSSRRVHKKDWKASGVPFLRAREIVTLSKSGRVDNDLFIAEEHYRRLAREGLIPEPDDIMITGVGTIGVPYVVGKNDRFYFKDASVLILKNCFHLYPHYLRVVMQSPYWIEAIHKQSMGTTVHTLTVARAKEALIPLPPLAEQRHIVAKVDELMALVDALETQLATARTTAANLLAAAVAELTNGKEHRADADVPSGTDLKLAELVRARANERRIKITLDDL